MINLASRVKNIEMGFEKFFSLRKEGVIDLSVGEPGFDTPEDIKEAAFKAMKSGNIRYAPPLGNSDLREAISTYYKEEYGVDSKKENIMISHGAKGIIYALIQSIVERGDEVIVQDPGWVSYREIVKLAEGTVIPANNIEGEEKFVEDIENKITQKTKIIIFSNPCNPTGEVYSEKTIENLVNIARENNVLLVSDEPYDKIIFEGKHTSAGKFGLENVAVVNSFSKTYAMSGWRIGYIIAEEYIIEGMKRVQLHQSTSVAPFIQAAAKYALENGKEGIIERREIYKKRRDIFVKSLQKNLKQKAPKATFYYFPSISHLNIDGKTFVEKLIEKNVLSVPGYLFGVYAPNYVRFSFAKSEEELKRGAEIINEVIENLS